MLRRARARTTDCGGEAFWIIILSWISRSVSRVSWKAVSRLKFPSRHLSNRTGRSVRACGAVGQHPAMSQNPYARRH